MERYNDEIQLKDILIKLSEYKTELWNKKVKIILFSFLFFVFGILISFISATEYKADLTFVVEDQSSVNPSLGSLSGVASQFGFDLGSASSSTFSQENIMQLLKSRGVVEATLLRSESINGKKRFNG